MNRRPTETPNYQDDPACPSCHPTLGSLTAAAAAAATTSLRHGWEVAGGRRGGRPPRPPQLHGRGLRLSLLRLLPRRLPPRARERHQEPLSFPHRRQHRKSLPVLSAPEHPRFVPNPVIWRVLACLTAGHRQGNMGAHWWGQGLRRQGIPRGAARRRHPIGGRLQGRT